MTAESSVRSAYDRLIEHVKETALLRSCGSILAWDRETYMPVKGSSHRAEQLALISGLAHQRDVDPRVGQWLAECEDSGLVDDPLSVEAVNIREIRRDYNKLVKVPRRLVEELARTTSLGHQAWIDARGQSAFSIFEPWLKKVVDLKREYAETVGYEDCIYDALLDDYEPGEKTANVSRLFDSLKEHLVPLIDTIVGRAAPRHRDAIRGRYAIGQQRKIAEVIASAIGFDFDSGRLDTVVHPFCTRVGPDDTRITTRWDETDFSVAFFGILHECGHALYDQGLPQEHWGTPMGEPVSLAIHESQSRLWENIVGRSQAFWEYFLSILRDTFPNQLTDASVNSILRAVNQVERSFIRVEADEATYTLHIILRFELEQQLMSRQLDVRDVPDAWNESFARLFDRTVPDDARGCLQDVHWSLGSFGYFPTYALGNLYAAQFFDRASNAIPELEPNIRDGNFTPLLEWLRESIHRHGKRRPARDLVRDVTGKPLQADYFVDYLKRKFDVR